MHMQNGFIHTSLCYQLLQTEFINNKDLIYYLQVQNA